MRGARPRGVVALLLAWALIVLSLDKAPAARLLSFVNEQQGWMVGFDADVYYTDDGGGNWQLQSTPTTSPLRALCFVDPQHGWAVGDGGTILQTVDGGGTWQLSSSGTNADLLDVFFFDALHGWAVGEQATLTKTTDGGNIWRSSRVDAMGDHGSLTGVSFHRYSDGLLRYGLACSADGALLRTYDSGKKWFMKVETAYPCTGIIAVNQCDWTRDIAFNFAVGLGGTFVHCHDHNFTARQLPGQPDLAAIDFVDDQVGWLVGEEGHIRNTTDGGQTWTEQNVLPFNLESVQCVDGDRAWILSEPAQSAAGEALGRVLFITSDGGVTWRDKLVPSGRATDEAEPPARPTFAPDTPFAIAVPNGHPISNIGILPDHRPLVEAMRRELTITACRGEYEPATFTIRSSVPLEDVLVAVDNLRAAQDPEVFISKTAVDVRWVKCWHQVRGGLVPELLLKNDTVVPVGDNTNFPPVDTETIADSTTLQPLRLPAGFTKQVWLTLQVPDDAQPGTYEATVSVTAKDHEPRLLNLRVQVLPFALAPPRLDYGLYVNAEMCSEGLACRLYPRTPEQVHALLRNLRAHGITHPYVHQPISIKPASRDPDDPNGIGTGGVPWQEIQYAPENLRRYLEMMDDVGFAKDKLFWGNSYMMVRINYSKHQTVGDPNLTKWPPEAFMPTLNIVTQLAGDFGYGEAYFYGMDEVSKQQLEFQRTLFEMMRGADTPVPAKTFSAAGRPTDVYDATTCSLLIAQDAIRTYQATGRKCYIYANPVSGVEQPYTYRRNVGLLPFKLGIDGTGWWCDYFTGGNLDYSFVYYTTTGQIDTLQWEGWREGVDDVRYLTTLEEAVAASTNQDLPAVTQARSWLAGLRISDDAHQVRQQAIKHIMALRALRYFALKVCYAGVHDEHTMRPQTHAPGFAAHFQRKVVRSRATP